MIFCQYLLKLIKAQKNNGDFKIDFINVSGMTIITMYL